MRVCPEGMLTIGRRRQQTAEQLVDDPHVPAVSFVGSSATAQATRAAFGLRIPRVNRWPGGASAPRGRTVPMALIGIKWVGSHRRGQLRRRPDAGPHALPQRTTGPEPLRPGGRSQPRRHLRRLPARRPAHRRVRARGRRTRCPRPHLFGRRLRRPDRPGRSRRVQGRGGRPHPPRRPGTGPAPHPRGLHRPRSVPQEARDSLGRQVPHPARLGDPAEFAALVRHIGENSMLHGEVLRLDGAMPPRFRRAPTDVRAQVEATI